MLMKNTTLEKAKERAGNLGEALCKVYTGGSIHYRISASIGLAACNGGDGNTYSSLFEKRIMPCIVPSRGQNGYEIAGAKDVGMIRNGIKTLSGGKTWAQKTVNSLHFPSVLWRTPKYRRVAEYAFKQDYGKIPAGSCYGI